MEAGPAVTRSLRLARFDSLALHHSVKRTRSAARLLTVASYVRFVMTEPILGSEGNWQTYSAQTRVLPGSNPGTPTTKLWVAGIPPAL